MFKQMSTARMLPLTGVFVLALGATSSVDATVQTANLSVTASVSASCTIATSPVAFGAYDPLSANVTNPLNGTGTVTVTCTSGASTTITLDQGLNPNTGSTDAAPARRLTDGSSHYLTYALYQDSARGTVWGNTSPTGEPVSGTGTANAVTVYGQVAAGQSAVVGNYSDTVVATVTF